MDRYEQIKMRLAEKKMVFNSNISLDEVERFEKEYDIVLPDGYRNFLLRVANGGIMLDGFPLLQLSELKIDKKYIQKEFPLAEYWIWENDKSIDDTKRESIRYGNLEMIDIGDCQTWNLILSGSCTGEMWLFTDVGVQPACPRCDFVSWFEYWLDGKDDYFSGFIYS